MRGVKTATQTMRKRTPLLGATLLLLATLVVVDAKFRGCLSGYTSCDKCCDVNPDCICDKVCGGNDERWPREAAYIDSIGCSYTPPQGSGVQGCAAQYKACPSCCGVYACASTRRILYDNPRPCAPSDAHTYTTIQTSTTTVSATRCAVETMRVGRLSTATKPPLAAATSPRI